MREDVITNGVRLITVGKIFFLANAIGKVNCIFAAEDIVKKCFNFDCAWYNLNVAKIEKMYCSLLIFKCTYIKLCNTTRITIYN